VSSSRPSLGGGCSSAIPTEAGSSRQPPGRRFVPAQLPGRRYQRVVLGGCPRRLFS
jgi:hypothetical protein